MLRSLIFFLLLLLLATGSQAQDVLTRTNGQELQVKVLEISPTEVRYKRFDNLDGPLVIMPRSEVFMIRYASGVKEVFGLPKAAASDASQPTTPPVTGRLVPGDDPSGHDGVHLSGPRLGATVLTGGARRRAEEKYELNPFLTQFGWQFETRLFRLQSGTAGLFEFVPLIGGLEQGKFIPSVNALLGIRSASGLELGMGPNLSPTGAGLTLAAGATIRSSSGINFPVNLAVVPGHGGARVSLLIGFTTRDKY